MEKIIKINPKTMTPKTINISYTAEDGTTHSREYTDLSQVWHPASEPPRLFEGVIIQQYEPKLDSRYFYCCFADRDEIEAFRKLEGAQWAYVEDLFPSATCSESPSNPSKKSNSWKLPRPTIKKNLIVEMAKRP